MSNYTWYLENDLKKYAGKWIAIFEEKVIAANNDFKQLTKDITKKAKLSDVFFARIPEKGVALVYIIQC